MKRSTVFLFSGQGSHYFQMGKSLYDGHPAFRHHLDRVDDLARESLGQSVIAYMYDGGRTIHEPFDRLLFSHPAIFMVEYALAKTLEELGIRPDILLGSSLGEFTAAVIGGMVEVADAIEILVQQARMVEQTCPPGGMVAVLDSVSLYHDSPALRDHTELAGVNFDGHFVISGDRSQLARALPFLSEKGVTHQVLPLSHGFHSAGIDAMEAPYRRFMGTKPFGSARLPLVSCCLAGPLESVNADYPWHVLRKPIRFHDTLRKLEETGHYTYIDLGPSKTLAGFVKYGLPQTSRSEVFGIISRFGDELEQLQGLQKHFGHGLRSAPRTHFNKSNDMIAYVFPGQGAQKKGMGAGLFERYPDWVATADSILGYSIRELCLDDPDGRLAQTQFTQPALYVVNALTYLAKIEDSGIKPAFLAGHSLGEYNALFAAGVFDFATGLKLTMRRGELMSRAAGGGMAAVIGLAEADVRRILADFPALSLSNLNSPKQFVIGGLKADVVAAESAFLKGGAQMFVPLQVSGAFHTPLMRAAEDEFRDFAARFAFADPQIPVVANATARPYAPGQVRDTLVSQITRSVQWTDSIRYLMGRGVSQFEEVGPGNVLTRLIAQITQESTPLVVPEASPLPLRSSTVAEAPRIQESPNTPVPSKLTATTLGSADYRRDHNLRYAYSAGAMYRGIASEAMVVRLAKAGFMSFFGTGGLSLERMEQGIRTIQAEVGAGQTYGMNLLASPFAPKLEEATVDLFLRYGITRVEAAAFVQVSPALVRFRVAGLASGAGGGVITRHMIQAKLSRPEVARAFMSPAPESLVNRLLHEGSITAEQARLARLVPMADDICVEADSGGHTDRGIPYTLMPAVVRLRDQLMKEYGYRKRIRVGAAGGIGTPEAAAAAFMLGAEFIGTGSINQCSVEAGTSDAAKDMLQAMEVQDTAYCPAGDMFEMGARVQVLKKGLLFPGRAEKLYDLYLRHNSLEDIDPKTRQQIQERYFRRSFEDVWADVREYFSKRAPEELEKAEINSKHRMALVFRWYFGHTSRLAQSGDQSQVVDYQIHTGPALGAFNQWMRGTPYENWRNRHVDDIGKRLMEGTAEVLNRRFAELMS
ncbi:ACP S-malonyltransferase [Methylomagnum sp.]